MSETASTRTPLSPTPRSSLTRSKERGRTDRADLDAILDAGLLCHLGVILHGTPVVLPTIYGRDGDTLYLHGSTGSGNMRAAMTGDVSLTVTHVDGIVYARSAMHFSMNYRSAVIHARPTELTDPDERMHALRIIVDQAAPGAWDAVRSPNKKEMAATMVLVVDLTEASVKVRTGGPRDDAEDIATGGVWAGVLPIRQVFDAPIPSDDLDPGIEVPAHVLQRCSDAVPAAI
ncbi:pyridoxamine 5'-phosphate oxidase family protein [Nocardia seriolae]|uniref:pyridoxamine 5'-phosphate oxidase family protein n=1 Tax=Nocardia seriolae TaxID=37332 RepID=UPI0008FF6518|nr:pyridoxamine 5'-phosphate oxidase family protein [Nocardia seriolae]OJF78203.1 flavin-nucleotide-binding protein [Nocardia seriolae]PSK32738.1 pyridoxamine 5'-phosphate oxidase family protein [Nocardia seriolae]QOW31578.1 pyridoxamine 5'-phosphate oxidase family protein [Nocardia seriolae]QUN19190.1 pyridoxamine 5'-phosphate oxidase family protein [Nocardia seriolae]WNJ58621.1 pyridoxamine 5'-phosphate oxidase family protein [Nocardia seriolae]